MDDNFEKRILLAAVLTFVVLLGYQFFFAPPPPPPAKKPAQIPDVVKEIPRKATDLFPAEEPALSVPEGAEGSEERLINVETPLYSAVFSSRGGTIKKWRLKKYRDDAGLEVILMRPGAKVPALALGTDGESFALDEVNFAVTGVDGDIVLKNEGDQAVITFLYRGGGLSIKRTYTISADNYDIKLVEEVEGTDDYWLTLGSGFGISGAEGYGGHIGPVILKDADRVEIKPKKLKEPRVFGPELKWIAQEDKYFFASIVPLGKAAGAKVWRSSSGEVLVAVNLPAGRNELLLYAGPKEHDRLKGFGVGLEYIVDFGFFSILARPLFWILKLFYKVIGNYGWSIALLTILVRIPFIPLINKGQRSMKKLQALQPRMNEIRQKYKKDPQKMQREMMELYRKYKVNPMSGCLPMLIQIPVFFALYKVLLVAIELRRAPFIFWIQDLSEKDPYYILPIIMGVTMFIQQRMTPTTMESQQQKIMNFLPLVFTFLFLNFPSGLVLYWLVSNLLSILQQYFVNRKVAREGEAA
ncbi:MAG TPA: membrane protein insertase YidC [Nitrospirae bacterium]|nr:membrane protein insertase YidC [Nitrospirota bacterium]